MIALTMGWPLLASLMVPAGLRQEGAPAIALSTMPEVVYKTADGGKRRTESWSFDLILSGDVDRTRVRLLEARLDTFAAQECIETRILPGSTLERRKRTSYLVTDGLAPGDLRRRYGFDEILDLGLDFLGQDALLGADSVRVVLRAGLPGGEEVVLETSVPVRTYQQRTELVFPFRGAGIVSQGPLHNGGHTGVCNHFAIDVLALTPAYAPMVGAGDENSAFSSWGHEVIAPAGGIVLYARSDVPDNPVGADPASVYGRLPDPVLATAGNAVVIDHGQREYSVLMHMQEGSVRVSQGQLVERGETIGRIGSSGDSFQPHLHYQLQSGPELFRDPSVPVRFSNLPDVQLVRGQYFRAT